MSVSKFVEYESINLNRADGIISRSLKDEKWITRVEIILTNRCNLNCVYCQKRIEKGDSEDRIPLDILLENIAQWKKRGCKFFHITGGEATVIPYLDEVVKAASGPDTSVVLSSNATNKWETYRNLFNNGLTGIHVSLDTLDGEAFDEMVRLKGSFKRVIKNLKNINLYNDEHKSKDDSTRGAKVKLTINSCLTPDTIFDVPNIVQYLLEFKPFDIKLIPIAQLKNEWPQYEDRYKKDIYPKLQELLKPYKPYELIMLRKRIETLVKESFRGFEYSCGVPCYLSAEERTVSPEGDYYGCYINYREGGEVIGNIIQDDIIVQEKKLKEYAMKADKSLICSKYCAEITTICNQYIHENLSKYNK